MSYVFISYSSKDRAYADRLRDELIGRGFDVWMDYRNIPFEEGFLDAIAKAIRSSGAVVVLMSPNSEKSGWVEKEYYLADKASKKLFPILLAGEAFNFFVSYTYADGRNSQLPIDRWYTELAQEVLPKTDAKGNDVTPPNLSDQRRSISSSRLKWTILGLIGLLIIIIITYLSIGIDDKNGSTDLASEGLEQTKNREAVVQLLVSTTEGDNLSGTGVIVNATGIIFTAAHVVEDAATIRVGIYGTLGHPSIPTFYAEPLLVSEDIDFAVIRISKAIDSSILNSDDINLGHIQSWNSRMAVGDRITIWSYPQYSSSIFVSDGIISSVEERPIGSDDRSNFIQTNASIGAGSTGGMAVNANNEFIGIPIDWRGDQSGASATTILTVATICDVEPQACQYLPPETP